MDNLTNVLPVLLSIPEAAKRTNLSEYYIRRLCHNREIAFIRCGSKYLINYQKFCEFLNSDSKD